MVVVHHLNRSRSRRVLWLLEELGVDYKIEFYQRDPVTMRAPDALKKIHPLGKVPIVVDGPHTVTETGAIIEYLLDAYGEGRLRPAQGSPEHLRYRYWMHFAEGSVMPPLLLSLIMGRIESAKLPFFVKPVAKGIVGKVRANFLDGELSSLFGYMEAELANGPWLLGESFTAADVQMCFPLEMAAERGAVTAEHPRSRAYIERCRARPAYVRALEKGGE